MLFIDGVWEKGHGKTFTAINPATGAVNWQGEAADKEDVARAFVAARRAFPAWSLTSLSTRIEYLRKLQILLNENVTRLAQSISNDTGKVLWECVMEAQSMVNKIDISIEAYGVRTGDTTKTVQNYQLHLRHRPIGVLAIFVPFNFPGHLLNTHVVPALLAGNTVVVKPSEQTPNTAQLVVELWQKCGLPSGVINLVQGASETGQALAAYPSLNGICFTGSFKIGQLLHQQLAGQTDKMLVLEMGGNNPLIVANISKIDSAVFTIIQSCFISAGQRCTCTRRLIIVENDTTLDLISHLLATLQKMRVDYPNAVPEPFMGPVISQSAGEKVLAQQRHLQQLGGKSLLTATQLDPHNAALLSPGVIDVTGINAPDEEIFGPVLQIHRAKDLKAAIEIANNTQYGLTAGILTDDPKEYEQFFNHARAGTVNWNRPTTGISGMAPFTGLGHSGNFRPTGYYAADYCAYPVISAESSQLNVTDLLPGLVRAEF